MFAPELFRWPWPISSKELLWIVPGMVGIMAYCWSPRARADGDVLGSTILFATMMAVVAKAWQIAEAIRPCDP